MMRDVRIKENHCPYCDHKLDSAGSPEGYTPSPGDWSVCIRCASPLVFTDDLTLRKPFPEDLAELDSDPEVAENLRKYQRAIRSLDRRDWD